MKRHFYIGFIGMFLSFTLSFGQEFIEYHKNGQISLKGEYSNNNRTGEWIFYNENGQIKEIILYMNPIGEGLESGRLIYHNNEHTNYDGEMIIRQQWGKSNHIIEKGNFYDITVPDTTRGIISTRNQQIKTGEWTFYTGNESNYMYLKENYKNGERNGESTSYYENGQIKGKGNHKDGKPDGKWVYYYENGQIKSKENYKYKSKDDMTGTVSSTYYSYYGNGQIKSELDSINGDPIGRSIWYYENGQIEKVYNLVWNVNEKNGYIIEESENIWYYENGQIEKEQYSIDGRKVGKWIWYYENGQIEKEENYKDGKLIETKE